jgi:uncharacterized membrane protein
MEYLVVKWVHVISSTVLFGTGIGSAFYLLVAVLSRDLRFTANILRWVVRADWLFTATTAVVQPLSGFWLLHLAGIPASTRWVAWSLALYVAAIACWLPVVWLQIQMRDLASHALYPPVELGEKFWRYFTVWIILGAMAFCVFLTIFWLMVAKPA